MFSFIEVMPLLLMIVEAIENRRRMKEHKGFAHRVALTYIMGAGVWNFFGAGVLGGLINTPLMNYYEHGTFLTLAHAHTAMFGAFGLLGFGLVYFALRYFVGDEKWTEKPAMWAFWLYNAGMMKASQRLDTAFAGIVFLSLQACVTLALLWPKGFLRTMNEAGFTEYG